MKTILMGVTLVAMAMADSAPALPVSIQPVSMEMRADLMMVRRQYREAIGFYKKAGQDSPVILNKTGMAYYELNDFPDAKKYYERAAKLKPDYAQAINNIGTVDYAQKNYRRAIGLYRKALRLEPQSAPFLSNLGTAYFARKNYALAFAEYEAAMKIDPDIFEYRDSLGSTLVERNVEERAKLHFYLARAYAKEGSVDRALQYLRMALEEGFRDRKQIADAPEFAPLKNNEEFIQIMASEPRVPGGSGN